MIKNLLNADEETASEKKIPIEKNGVEPIVETGAAENPPVEDVSKNLETRPLFEIPEDAKFFSKPFDAIEESVAPPENSEPQFEESPKPAAEPIPKTAPLVEPVSGVFSEPIGAPVLDETAKEESADSEASAPVAENTPAAESPEAEKPLSLQGGTLFQSEPKADTTGDTIRQTGLAWSAGIVFFGSIVFMMIFGWVADLLLGSTPWGLVGGIVLGAIIGFVQFFRITSQIFKK